MCLMLNLTISESFAVYYGPWETHTGITGVGDITQTYPEPSVPSSP